MSRKTRTALLIIGLAVILVGVGLLMAALAPGTLLRAEATLVPTLLAPPRVLP